MNGISAESISETLQIAVGGQAVDLLHLPREKEDVDILLQVPRANRATTEELLALRVRSTGNPGAPLVPLRELVKVEQTVVDKSLYHKNLMPVTYVIGDVAGVVESPVYAILNMNQALKALDTREFGGSGATLKVFNAVQPFTDGEPALKWDGEWHITIEVFRDLGSAFAACLVLMFILMVGWFRSFLTPLIVMMAIPFSLVGIMPAHGALGAFFTATSMIGFMAGAGIVVRNSIILVDFIEQRVAEGLPLAEAVVDAGAVRFRPMLLTALAVVVGASVILADPIFQGLAISLMAGEIASLLISRMAVPVLYFMATQFGSLKTRGNPHFGPKHALHHRIQKNIRIRECIRWNHHWGHQTQTTTLCSRSNPHQRRGTFAKSSRNKLIREKPCFCPSFRMCRKGGVPKARILKRRPKLMLEVRWFFRVQILWHRDYWRVVPNPISLESGEKVFQIFFPYVRSHLPPPIMPHFHPHSLKNPPIPPYSQKNAQPNFCGAV